MKVIKKGNYNDGFPMRVVCRRVTDEYGFGYGDPKDFCGSTLEIKASDIKKHPWSKYPAYHGIDYGVVCPVCGKFIPVEKRDVPKNVLDDAEEISVAQGDYYIMAKYCPIVEKRVVYLTCQECEDKVCFKQNKQQANDAKESAERKEEYHGKSENV